MSSESFESAIHFLKRLDVNGRIRDEKVNDPHYKGVPSTLYDHLTNVVLKLIQDNSKQPLQALEHLSLQLKKAKQTPTVYKEFQTTSSSASFSSLSISSSAQLAAIDGTLAQLSLHEQYETKEEGPAVIPDVLEETTLLEEAGIVLKSKEDAYLLYLEMKELAKKHSLSSVRVFGRIQGIQSDYLIVEAKESEPSRKSRARAVTDKEKSESRLELPGVGANEYIYFVRSDNHSTFSSVDSWQRLPDVLPEQIQLARQMRRYFTGNLSAPVLGYPAFRWPESVYLRAQLARISAAALLAPVGFYALEGDDEDEHVVREEEWNGLALADATQAESWAHYRKYLLRAGRTSVYEEPEREDEEEEEDDEDDDAAAEVEEEDDLPIRLLSTCDADRATGLATVWSFRLLPAVDVAHPTLLIRSMLWPGAYTAARGTAFVNVYVGNGQKWLSAPWSPPPPPAIQAEYVSRFNVEDEETDPLVEQTDPLPPEELPEEKEEEGVEGEEEDEEQEDEEEQDEEEDDQ